MYRQYGEITIRDMDVWDIPKFLSIRNYNKEYLHDSRLFGEDQAKDWFVKTPHKYFIIEYFNDMIGYFRTSDWDYVSKKVCVGADLSPEFQNKGYGYKVYNLFLDYLFNELDMHRVWLEVLATNGRAIHLYTKLGFFIEGTKNDDVYRDGRYINTHIMAIIKDGYENRNSDSSS